MVTRFYFKWTKTWLVAPVIVDVKIVYDNQKYLCLTQFAGCADALMLIPSTLPDGGGRASLKATRRHHQASIHSASPGE